jgi:hypothetical protein
MKLKTYLFSLLVVGFLLPLRGADGNTTVETVPAAPSAVTARPDDLANFVLEKAKLYSEKGEAAVALAVDVLTAEAPLVVEEFLAWRFLHAIFYAIWPVMLFLIVAPFAYGCIRRGHAISKTRGDDYRNDREVPWFIGGMVLSGIAFVCLLAVGIDGVSSLMEAVQIHVAPRVYLIEHAAALLK